jgi:hypothetical protein
MGPIAPPKLKINKLDNKKVVSLIQSYTQTIIIRILKQSLALKSMRSIIIYRQHILGMPILVAPKSIQRKRFSI